MQVPKFTAAEQESRDTFLALLHASSRPGTIHNLSADAYPQYCYPQNFSAIANTLIDLETTFYAHDDVLAMKLRRSGARPADLKDANYVMFPSIGKQELDLVKHANIGSMMYPDQSASIYIGCQLHGGTALELTGPGIDGKQAIQVNGIPAAFWTLREEAADYPLGWDVFLIDGDQVIAILRSTKVTVSSS
jgi:alpha-D-ribose 1-methylphosphonate 5-triphosphate synthase subunit PhnH